MPTVQVAHAVDNASVMVAGSDEKAAIFKRDPLKEFKKTLGKVADIRGEAGVMAGAGRVALCFLI